MYSDGNFTECLVAATQAVEVARLVGSADVLVEALSHCAWALADLGRTEEGLAMQQDVQVNRDTGRFGQAIAEAAELAEFYNFYAGNVDRGLEIGRRGFEEGLAQGFPVQAALCGARRTPPCMARTLRRGGAAARSSATSVFPQERDWGPLHFGPDAGARRRRGSRPSDARDQETRTALPGTS